MKHDYIVFLANSIIRNRSVEKSVMIPKKSIRVPI